MMRELIPVNTGGGLKPEPQPSATMNEGGSLTLNSSAYALIGGSRWRVRYEDNPSLRPAIELVAAGNTDTGAFAVTRSNVSAAGSGSAKVALKSLRSHVRNFDAFVGSYRVEKIARGLRLVRSDE